MEECVEFIRQNSAAKFDLLKTVVERSHREETQSELELFFKSICKTVEKFNALEQAKTKIEITNIVSNIQIAKYELFVEEQNHIIDNSELIFLENIE